ncbi:uncharacterized protein TNCV_224871 [Trichonephila clavipes]|nr:uncharacterized protein TNCV_224871 [Trichonephila clavipes]
MNLTWRNPPAHHWYAAKSPGLSIQCRSSMAHQTALARFRSGHLRSMTFVQGVNCLYLKSTMTRIVHTARFDEMRDDELNQPQEGDKTEAEQYMKDLLQMQMNTKLTIKDHTPKIRCRAELHFDVSLTKPREEKPVSYQLASAEKPKIER